MTHSGDESLLCQSTRLATGRWGPAQAAGGCPGLELPAGPGRGLRAPPEKVR